MSKVIWRASSAILLFAVSFCCIHGEGNAQSALTTGTVTGIVQQSDGSPVVHATVQLTGTTTLTSQSDVSGTFVFLNVPLGNYRVVVNVKGLGQATREHIVVAGDMNVTVRYDSTSMNGLKVIASVSAMNRAQISTQPVSVTTLTPQTLADQGQNTWQRVLNEIPGVAVGMGSSNSLHCSSNFTQTFPDSPLGAQVLQIGGALPYESSASVDGMPISTQTFSSTGAFGNINGGVYNGGVDLGVLDPNAFSQYNINIGPGADAPSILDSVGGSLDLSPAEYVEKDRANFSVATDPYGGIVSNAAVAVRSGRLSVSVTYGANNSPGPLGGTVSEPEMSFSDVYSVDGRPFTCTNVPGCAVNPYFVNAPNATGYAKNFGAYASSLLACCVPMSSDWEQHSGSVSLSYQISPALTADVFYEGLQATGAAYTGYYPVTFEPPSGYSGSSFQSGGTYTLPFNGYGSEAGGIGTGTQFSSMVEEKIHMRLGKGQFTIAALQNRTGDDTHDQLALSANLRLWGGGCYTNGFFGPCTSPAVFNGGMYAIQSSFESAHVGNDSSNRDYSLKYSLPIGDRYQLNASYISLYVTQDNFCFGSSIVPFASGESTFSFGAPFEDFNTTQELHLSIGGAITPKLHVTLSDYLAALQYHGLLTTYIGIVGTPSFGVASKTYNNEHFSYQTPRLGMVFRASDSIAIRASAGGSFTAPPVANYIGHVGAICPNNIYAPSSPLLYYAEGNANTDLKSESSFGFSIGTDVRLAQHTLFTLDLYRTNLHGQFYGSQYQNGTLNGLPFYIDQTINLAGSRYQGVTAQIRHDVPRGWFSQLQFGFTRGYIESLSPGFYNNAPNVCDRVTGANCANIGTFPTVNYAAFPYSQGFGMLGYRWAPHRYLDFDTIYIGPNNEYFRPAFIVINADAEIPITKSLSLHATAGNITGIYDQAILSYNAFQNPVIGYPQLVGPAIWEPGLEYGPRSFTLRIDLHM